MAEGKDWTWDRRDPRDDSPKRIPYDQALSLEKQTKQFSHFVNWKETNLTKRLGGSDMTQHNAREVDVHL